ncbi:hypothetical protein MCUN1_001695 [Malassezia cuniculi]|uniref:Uncharacterized protein n=1 Tax=Malassezia cuniculi TaxID=948313 RepID=A0AAF0EQR9_9BASI|nr:hypothetical protein MCUN1_001695 [Malassezia cuniculi]
MISLRSLRAPLALASRCARAPVVPCQPLPSSIVRQLSTESRDRSNVVATYIGPMRRGYYRLKLLSLSSLAVSTVFVPIFIAVPTKVELAARVALSLSTVGASSISTALISWIGGPYVGHMTLRRSMPGYEPLHYISDGPGDVVLDDLPSDPNAHASEGYYLELATLGWSMRSLKTTIFTPSLLRVTTRPFATWELPILPPALTVDEKMIKSTKEHTVSKLISETVDVSSGKVIGRWWARWRVQPGADVAEFSGTCEAEGSPSVHFYVDESLLGDEWRVLG